MGQPGGHTDGWLSFAWTRRGSSGRPLQKSGSQGPGVRAGIAALKKTVIPSRPSLLPRATSSYQYQLHVAHFSCNQRCLPAGHSCEDSVASYVAVHGLTCNVPCLFAQACAETCFWFTCVRACAETRQGHYRRFALLTQPLPRVSAIGCVVVAAGMSWGGDSEFPSQVQFV
jgi:hypothetical protein